MRLLLELKWTDEKGIYNLVPEWSKKVEQNFDFPNSNVQDMYAYIVKWIMIFVSQSHPYSVAFNGFNWLNCKRRINAALRRYAKNCVGQSQYDFYPGAKEVPYNITFRFDDKKSQYLSFEEFAKQIINK